MGWGEDLVINYPRGGSTEASPGILMWRSARFVGSGILAKSFRQTSTRSSPWSGNRITSLTTKSLEEDTDGGEALPR